MLTQIQQNITKKFMSTSQEISSSEIQQICNISRKTLTKEIHVINHYLQKYGARIDTIKGRGYCLKINEIQKFNKFRIEFMSELQRNNYLYFDKNYLAYMIIFELVFQDSYINIDILVEKFHYSRGTISKSIKIAKEILSKYNCNLSARPNYGIRLNADEWTKRICLLFLDKIMRRMTAVIPEIKDYFGPIIDTGRKDYPEIVKSVNNLLNINHVHIPFVNLIKIKMYIILSQTRSKYYDQFFIPPEQEKVACTSHCFLISQEIANDLAKKNIIIKEKDIVALSILLISFSNFDDEIDIESKKLHDCSEDILDFIQYIEHFYSGITQRFDKQFFKEFSYFLIEIERRKFFHIPCDGEVGNLVKSDGMLILELCTDFSYIYYKKHKIIIPEEELFYAYFLFCTSFRRNANKKHTLSIAVISRYGRYCAHSVAEYISIEFGEESFKIDTFEYIDANSVNWKKYDILFTDVSSKYYNTVSIPIVNLDSYGEPQHSKSLTEYLALRTRLKLHEIIIDSNLIKNKKFNKKKDVFDYLAANYISTQLRREFTKNCILTDNFISNERCNRIAFVSTYPKYYNKKQIIILFSKAPFLWNNEKIQMIVFYNRRGQKYAEMKLLDKILICFLHSGNNIVQMLSRMDADAVVEYIVNHIYKSLSK